MPQPTQGRVTIRLFNYGPRDRGSFPEEKLFSTCHQINFYLFLSERLVRFPVLLSLFRQPITLSPPIEKFLT
jgi:hypothetical protein